MNQRIISVRVSDEVANTLGKVTDGPYAPTISQITQRGLELAFEELKKAGGPKRRIRALPAKRKRSAR
jgi:hypothetical protein